MRLFGFDIQITRAGHADPAGDAPKVWTPTHIHRKGGGYRYLYDGVLEADRSAVVVYDDAQGRIWVRSRAEFHDGRFQPVATQD